VLLLPLMGHRAVCAEATVNGARGDTAGNARLSISRRMPYAPAAKNSISESARERERN
jgi:hypothetical protein